MTQADMISKDCIAPVFARPWDAPQASDRLQDALRQAWEKSRDAEQRSKMDKDDRLPKDITTSGRPRCPIITARRQTVSRMWRNGKTEGQIGAALGISRNTVSFDVEQCRKHPDLYGDAPVRRQGRRSRGYDQETIDKVADMAKLVADGLTIREAADVVEMDYELACRLAKRSREEGSRLPEVPRQVKQINRRRA